MANALVRQDQPLAEQIEQAVIGGDLKQLSPAQRVSYYNRVCESVGLNPYTRPFDYLTLNNKLVLYARRDAADQLRSIHGISLSKPRIEYADDMVIVTVEASDKVGRTDTDLGAVSIKGLQGESRANAIMKAITKAKRRVTLSLAGLGWLDETEVDSIPGAQRVSVDNETGEIIDAAVTPRAQRKWGDTTAGQSLDPSDPTVDNPFDDAPATQAPLATAEQIKRVEEIGFECYQEKWETAERTRWVQWATTGEVSDINELQPVEAENIIATIGKRIAKKLAQQAPEKVAA